MLFYKKPILLSKKEFFKKVMGFFILGRKREVLYIQIHPPSVKRKFRSFCIAKNWLIVYCFLGFLLLQALAYYFIGTAYFRYLYINEKYQKMEKIEENISEYQGENEYYSKQLQDIKREAHNFYSFGENLLLHNELEPYFDFMSNISGVKQGDNFEELNSFVFTLHNQLKEMILFYSDKEYRQLFFTPSIVPIAADYRISSKYGFRKSPFNGQQEFHRGIDFCCPLGTAIRATAYGEVIFAGRYSTSSLSKGTKFGRMVLVSHGDSGFSTYYAHCSNVYVKSGDWVKRGQVIAAVGSSGASTAPHLHYEIRRYDRPRNPIYYLQDSRRRRDKFASIVEQ